MDSMKLASIPLFTMTKAAIPGITTIKGIKSFKKGMAEDEEPVQPKRPVAQIEAPPARTIDGTATTTPSEERKPG